MKLHIRERAALLGLLPARGDIATVRIVSDLRNDLGITEEEAKEINLQQIRNDGETITTWDSEKDTGKEFELGDVAKRIVRKALEELDEKGQLTADHIGLWELFME